MKLAKYAVIIPLISIVPIILLSGTAKGDVRTEIRLPSQYRDYESSRQHVFRKVTSYLSSIQNGSTKGVDTSRPLSSDDLEYAIDTIGKLTRHYDITDTEAPVFLRALKFLKTTLQDDYPEKLFLILYASLIEDRIHWFVENTDKRKSNFDWIVNNYKDAISEYEINKSEYTNLDAGIAIQMPILPLLLSIEALNFVNDKEKKAELFSGNIISNRQLFPRMPPQMFFSLSQAIVDTTSSNLDELLLRSWLVILDDLVGTSNPGFSHNVYTLAKIYARLGLIKIVQSRNAPREAAEIFQNIIDDYLPRVNNVTAGGPAAVRLFFGGDTTANLYEQSEISLL